jgi:hypothetical protein
MDEEFEKTKKIDLELIIREELSESARQRYEKSFKECGGYIIDDFRFDKIEIFEDGELYIVGRSEKDSVDLFLSICGEVFLNLLAKHKCKLFKAIEDRQRNLSDAKDVLDKL